jgi:LPXTG-site transpeptidase (sortase) family protein
MSDAASHRGLDWRTPVRWFGMACLMGASFFAGYVAWLLWGTGIETAQAQDSLRPALERSFANPASLDEAPPPGTREIPGSAYAMIQIPSIDIEFAVVEGTDYASLKKGPGHYPDTADPWDLKGRVGIAGHRTTYMAPFFDLEDVDEGDPIRLLTEYGPFEYEVTDTFVLPEDGSGIVLEQTERPTLVLTTCHPKYGSSQRLIVEAALVSSPAG